MFVRLSIAAAIAFASTPASATDAKSPFLRANWFVRNCDSAEWELACRAYVLGYYSGSQTREKTVCLPDGVDSGQLYDVALAYMRSQPAKGHIVGIMLMDEAWRAAFPCG